MKRYWKRKWVEALQSGKFRQGRSLLRRTTPSGLRHCCLGVLASLPAKAAWTKSSDYDHEKSWTIDGKDDILSTPLLEKFGLSEKEQKTLTVMNDDGKRFSTIARWIEDNL